MSAAATRTRRRRPIVEDDAMRRAHQIKAKALSYIVPGVPAGVICVVSGRPGSMKSYWTCRIAAQVSQFGRVIFSNGEDPAETVVRPRLEAAGAKLTNVYVPEEPFLLPQDCDELERRIVETDVRLLIADAAAQHLSVKTSSGQQVRKALTPLKQLLERTGASCIFVDHLVKRPAKTAHPLEALAGAGSGLPAAARWVWVFGPNPKDPDERILAPVKVNLAETPPSWAYGIHTRKVKAGNNTIEMATLELVNDESEIDASEVIAFNGGGKAADGLHGEKGAIAIEWLIGQLMFGEQAAADIETKAGEVGFGWRTVQRAADKLNVEKRREGFGPGSKMVWNLPANHPAVVQAEQMQKPPGSDSGKPRRRKPAAKPKPKANAKPKARAKRS